MLRHRGRCSIVIEAQLFCNKLEKNLEKAEASLHSDPPTRGHVRQFYAGDQFASRVLAASDWLNKKTQSRAVPVLGVHLRFFSSSAY